ASYRFSLTSGWETGRFHGLIGVELLKQNPLWMYDRKRQDSTDDNADPDGRVARRNFLRTDEYVDYLDPGAATCPPLASLNPGTTIYGTRPGYGHDIENDEYIDGHYCGSKEAVAYGTMISGRKSASLYTSTGYELSPNAELFLDAQFSYSKLKL